MTRIFAVTNQKGGVGKTTTAVNLAASLAVLGHRVLLADLDPQGNATTGVGVPKTGAAPTVYQLLLGEAGFDEVRITTRFGFDLLPANRELAGAEVELVGMEGRESRLKSVLAQAAPPYDYVLFDCPPALNLLTLNGLVAARAVIIPMQCEYYALEGLSDLVATLRQVRARLNPALEIEGLLRTMYDPRSTLAQQVSNDLERHFGARVYRTVIPRNVRLAEAPSYGTPAILFDRSAKGSHAYRALAREMLERADPEDRGRKTEDSPQDGRPAVRVS
ncbi:MAG TPA: chromosome partitioning protein [Rhodocyclaceae bacterium]|nr:MAG: chromosome partitioning protein [Rhodocyclales bacterium CG17_big_fil_post_rev_8_21_14_2_50_68_7]HCX32505.1 chromosome partitioning protein [Rhodocyclaceae bacterium]